MLWQEIESMCHRIKHLDAADIDLDAVRQLLRRAQAHIERQDELISRSVVPGRGVLRWLEGLADG